MCRPGENVTLDVDIFLKSDDFHVQLVPVGKAKGGDQVGVALRDARDDRVLFELRTMDGTWRCGAGGQLTDTGTAAAFDAWNHLQLVLDGHEGSCRVILQVLGEVPRVIPRDTGTDGRRSEQSLAGHTVAGHRAILPA